MTIKAPQKPPRPQSRAFELANNAERPSADPRENVEGSKAKYPERPKQPKNTH